MINNDAIILRLNPGKCVLIVQGLDPIMDVIYNTAEEKLILITKTTRTCAYSYTKNTELCLKFMLNLYGVVFC